jgi:hypothetical protein
VKKLKPEVLGSPDDLKEFLTEANLLRKMRHPWVAHCLTPCAGCPLPAGLCCAARASRLGGQLLRLHVCTLAGPHASFAASSAACTRSTWHHAS